MTAPHACACRHRLNRQRGQHCALRRPMASARQVDSLNTPLRWHGGRRCLFTLDSSWIPSMCVLASLWLFALGPAAGPLRGSAAHVLRICCRPPKPTRAQQEQGAFKLTATLADGKALTVTMTFDKSSEDRQLCL